MLIRLLSWNVHKGIGGVDRRYDIGRVIALIQGLEPDVLVLQEVSENMPRSHFHDQAELLSEALAMPHRAYHRQHRFSIGGYGNAILSRWPLSDVHELDLTIGTRKKRGALQARMRVRFQSDETRSVVVHNLHLGLAGTERARQLDRFLASPMLRRLHHGTPTVLAGDLNDLWGSLGPRFLLPAGFRRAGSLANTFPAVFPVRPLDGIFVRGQVRVRNARACRNKLARQASDHLPLLVELDLHHASDR